MADRPSLLLPGGGLEPSACAADPVTATTIADPARGERVWPGTLAGDAGPLPLFLNMSGETAVSFLVVMFLTGGGALTLALALALALALTAP